MDDPMPAVREAHEEKKNHAGTQAHTKDGKEAQQRVSESHCGGGGAQAVAALQEERKCRALIGAAGKIAEARTSVCSSKPLGRPLIADPADCRKALSQPVGASSSDELGF